MPLRSIANTTDKIVFNAFFYGNNPGNQYNGLQQIKFADGTTWDLDAILARPRQTASVSVSTEGHQQALMTGTGWTDGGAPVAHDLAHQSDGAARFVGLEQGGLDFLSVNCGRCGRG